MMVKSLDVIIEKITLDLVRYYPKTIVLFGSAARYLDGLQSQVPEDIDLLYVGSIRPIQGQEYKIPYDLFFFHEHEILSIAKSLRYSPKSMSRAKMYFKDTWKGYVRSDIAACLLLGPAYVDYGFLQMEDEEKPRDYSIHKVLYGEPWWRALQRYVQEYRGITGLVIDKVLGLDRFSAPD